MFLERFADVCGITKISIEDLSSMLEDNTEVDPVLEDIHIKLLRKLRKSVPTGKWQNALAKFAYSYSNQDAWEIERFGYKNSSLSVKLRVLKVLFESQFDRNVKFKSHINGIAAQDLRSEPLGKDRLGNVYWCIMDEMCSIRVFRENQDDESWTLVASNRSEVVNLIDKLKENDMNFLTVNDIVDEDSSSNSASIHSEKPVSTDPDTKRTSLILDRRVYKKPTDTTLVKSEIQDEHNKISTGSTNVSLTEREQNVNCKAISEVHDNGKNNTERNDVVDAKENKESLHGQVSDDGKNNTDSNDGVDVEENKESLHAIDQDNAVSDVVEDPVVTVVGEGSGVDCEAKPEFSDIIEEQTLYVYGLGSGVDNDMGNSKIGENNISNVDSNKNSSITENLSSVGEHSSRRDDNTSSNESYYSKKHVDVIQKGQNHGDNKSTTAQTSAGDENEQQNKHINKSQTSMDGSVENISDESAVIDTSKTSHFVMSHNQSDNEKIRIERDSTYNQKNQEDSLSTGVKKKSKEFNAKDRHFDHENATKAVNEYNMEQPPDTTVEIENKNLTLNEMEEPKKSNKRGRKTRSGIVDGLDISQVIIERDGSPPVRQSRRIAQQKIKEETNRRMIEEKMLREMKAEAIKKRKKSGNVKSEDEEYILSEDDNSRNTLELKTHKRKSDKPWLSSSSESSSESDQEEDYVDQYHSDGRRSPLESDHEFSPESDLESGFVVPTKRARTVRAEKETDDESIDSNSEHACQKCNETDHPEWILLCDSCDKGYHCSCLVPVLFIIPEGDWFCPVCQHRKLITNLQEKLAQYDEKFKQLEVKNILKKQEAKNLENLNNAKRMSKVLKTKNAFANQECTDNSRSESPEKNSSPPTGSDKEKSDESDSDDDDIPIYKLRRRNQSNYKFNDYDNLIDSAINRSATKDYEDPVSRGKDIRNIMLAEEKSTECFRKSGSRSPVTEKLAHHSNKTSKKKKRLNNLDVSSEADDGSDEDFKEVHSSTDDEESYSMTEESESSLELMMSRKSRMTKKKYDMDFINDDDSDKSTYNMRKQRKKINKILDDSDEFDEDDMTESEEIDSDELCSDTETDSSQENWKARKHQIKKVTRLPGKTSNNNKKRKPKKTDEDKSYRSGSKVNKTIESASSSSAEDKTSNSIEKRRTRGKKLHYIVDDDFESSDDGITPGVQRPDTPPEERERFIKKQEEIKRMLAEKNTAAAKELATPKIKSLFDLSDKTKPASLSTVPLQVIESAKILDVDFLKSSKNIDSDEFDDELGVHFPDPEDVNEDELAKIMEDEDFAQHHLKLEYEESLKGKSSVENTPKKKSKDFDSINPSDITKLEKKVTPFVADKRFKPDPTVIRKINEIDDSIHKNSKSSTLPIQVNEPQKFLPAVEYHSLLPSVSCAPSLLQQMKQQAIPLREDSHHSVKFLPSTFAITNEKSFSNPETSVFTGSKIPESIGATPQPEVKDGSDVRRRRRKKITPLRGDLYKLAEDRASGKMPTSLPYHIASIAAPLSLVAAPDRKMLDYACAKAQTIENTASVSTSIKCSTKMDSVELRYSNTSPYAPLSGYPQEQRSNTTISTSNMTCSIAEHQSHREFIALEPVNSDETPVEPSPSNTETAGCSQNVDTESTSEFSGLVSYFSSQQNELNA